MTAVLLRVAGFDAFDGDTQAQPPHGESAQAEQGIGRGKGCAVVSADGVGQAEVLESPFKHGKGEVGLGGGQAFTAQQVAGAIIGDGERIAILLVAEQELALVVSAPEAVGLVSGRQRRALGLVAATFASCDEAVAIEYGMHGADGGWLDHAVIAQQLVADLGSSPGRVLFLDAEDGALDLERQFVGLAVGPTTAVVETVQTALPVTIEDLVSGDAGNAELAAQGRHFLAFQQAGHKLQAFIHWLTLIPGHPGSPQMPNV